MNNSTKLKLIDRQYATIPTFQCVEGCTDCCGPILSSRLEYRRMLEHAQRSEREVSKHALANLESGNCNCPFVSNGGCSVYAARPAICRLFGAVDDPRLVCPHGKRPAVLLTNEQADAILKRYGELGQ